jgi:hypothetical protein
VRKFLKWCGRSLLGVVVFFEVFCSIPLVAWGLSVMKGDGTLSLYMALRLIVVTGSVAAVCGALYWYTFWRPMLMAKGILTSNNRRSGP